jgi:hypothetical protein
VGSSKGVVVWTRLIDLVGAALIPKSQGNPCVCIAQLTVGYQILVQLNGAPYPWLFRTTEVSMGVWWIGIRFSLQSVRKVLIVNLLAPEFGI